jgi:hypothetical protein
MVTRGPSEVQLTAVIRAKAVNFQAGHAVSITVARSYFSLVSPLLQSHVRSLERNLSAERRIVQCDGVF